MTMLPSSPPDESRFTLVCPISSGGCGCVALYLLNGTTILRAVKTARSQQKEDDLAKFQREVHTLHLNQHPTIIRVFNYGVPADGRAFQPWMELEFIPGGSVSDMLNALAEDEDIDATTCHVILTGLAYALTFLHARCVIHRDVKPANVMLDERREPRLADFGFAREVFPGDDVVSYPRTMNYAAPEVLKAQSYSHKVDVYGFGMTLYEIRRKEVPFTDRPRSQREIGSLIMNGKRPDIGFKDPYFELYSRCTAFRQSDRPDMIDVLTELQRMALTGCVDIDMNVYGEYVQRITEWSPEVGISDAGEISRLVEAAKTCPKAMYELGWCYYKGILVDADVSKAGELFARSAEFDFPSAVEVYMEMIENNQLPMPPSEEYRKLKQKLEELGDDGLL